MSGNSISKLKIEINNKEDWISIVYNKLHLIVSIIQWTDMKYSIIDNYLLDWAKKIIKFMCRLEALWWDNINIDENLIDEEDKEIEDNDEVNIDVIKTNKYYKQEDTDLEDNENEEWE